MSKKPQDYVSERGRTTTNAVEGFHGIALRYRSKRTDLGHTHYVCKTNMAICHKVQLYVQYQCTYWYLDRTWVRSGKLSAS